MRTYLPLTVADLRLPQPPQRDVVVAGDVSEEAEESALDEAAFRSLQLSFDRGRADARLVAVGSGPIGTWEDVDSLHADANDIGPELVALNDAVTQEELDAATEALWAHDLQWYDISEREGLYQRLCDCRT